MTRHRPPDDADSPVTDVEFPELDAGLVLLDLDERLVHALGALVVDHLLRSEGLAWWVDADGHARTTVLGELAPSRRLLDRVRVARAFTAFQHATLLRTLAARTADAEPALVVCPGATALARAADLDARERDRLLLTGVASLARLARAGDCPVLVTRGGEAPARVDAALERAADRVLTCERTRFGPRFAGDGVETLVYPADASGWRQTTLAYWARVLAARADGPGTAARAGGTGAETGAGTGPERAVAPGEVSSRGAH